MPAQDRVGPHQQSQAGPRKVVQQRRQPCPVSRFEPNPQPPELAPQHHELVPKGEYLRVLVTVAAQQQPQQRERAGDPSTPVTEP